MLGQRGEIAFETLTLGVREDQTEWHAPGARLRRQTKANLIDQDPVRRRPDVKLARELRRIQERQLRSAVLRVTADARLQGGWARKGSGAA